MHVVTLGRDHISGHMFGRERCGKSVLCKRGEVQFAGGAFVIQGVVEGSNVRFVRNEEV